MARIIQTRILFPIVRSMAVPLKVIREARACTACAASLPLGPRPLVAGSSAARILIVGQAPGRRAHESGIPWHDPSGDRLRAWLGIDDDTFYDPRTTALMPMGFCFPGTGASGDLPPRPECAPLWHDRLSAAFRSVRLTVLVGRYAIDAKVSPRFRTVTDAVRAWNELLPERIALPHPSGRNNIWLKKNPWFERETLPALRRAVTRAIDA